MTYDDNEKLESRCDFYCRELENDPAAERSVRRRFEELRDDLNRGEISIERALSALAAEFDDCQPE